MSHINKIEGIGPSHTKKFAEVGVTTVEHLLKAGATPKGRKELATKTGASRIIYTRNSRLRTTQNGKFT
jgi:predicted RecB family nuclease